MDSNKRNIYKEGVNFIELASQDIDFAKVLKPNGQLDFSDPDSVQQLTKSLLKRDFGLILTLPPDRLCPPVPNRLNYVLWIQDLLDTTSDGFSDRYDPKREVIGLDIGTGASCIYPLLGCAQRPKWRFAATDIDNLSLEYANQNIRANNLLQRIQLLNTTPNDQLIPLDTLKLKTINFSLCNPPFYTSNSSLLVSATAKSRPPYSACTGSETEMVTPGGETAFTTRMIAESLILRDRVQWYTSMLGKLSSVSVIVEELRRVKIENYAVTELLQGAKTRRWAVGWSFGDLRPRVDVARGVAGHGVPKGLLPFPSEYRIRREGDVGVLREQAMRDLNATIEALPLRWVWKERVATGVGFAARNVWSRAARRRLARQPRNEDRSGSEGVESDVDEDEMAFGFKISLQETTEVDESDGNNGLEIVIRWLKGHDSALFESFCGMIKRKLET